MEQLCFDNESYRILIESIIDDMLMRGYKAVLVGYFVGVIGGFIGAWLAIRLIDYRRASSRQETANAH